MNVDAALIGFAAAVLVAAIATPVVGRLARAVGVVDQPGPRRVNQRSRVPLLGGLAIAVGLAAGLALALFLHAGTLEHGGEIKALLLGGALLLGVGAIDDRWGLRATPKFTAQLVAAAIAISYGLQIDYVRLPVTNETWWLAPWLAWIVSALFIVGVTNSINLLDGLDGVATGVAVIIAATLTALCWLGTQRVGFLIGAAFVGAMLGFLPFNYPPARIFLGDTGALFIGYALSLLALESYRQAIFVPFIVPLLALSVPMIDTLLSILRRVRSRRRIFTADRQHMHHRMLEIFGSQRSAAHQMYGITFIFCLIAIFITRLKGYWFILYLLLVIALTLKMLRNLGLFEITGDESVASETPPAAKRES